MEILITALIAILSYKIKLIDDRKNNNLEKYKNYFKRTILSPASKKTDKDYDATEVETWLDKDIPCHMISWYKESKNNTAILDFYQDYKDNENDKLELRVVIVLNILYLLFHTYIPEEWVSKIVFDLIIILSILKSFAEPNVSIINNPLVNVDNSIMVKTQRDKIKMNIENEFLKYKKKYFLIDLTNKYWGIEIRR